MTHESAPRDEREMLARLRESEELYARAFMSNPVAMSITALESGRFSHINAAFTALVGYNRAEVLGRTSAELGFWPDRAERDRVGERLSQGGEPDLIRATVRIKDGSEAPVLVSFRLLDVPPAPAVLTVLVPLESASA